MYTTAKQSSKDSHVTALLSPCSTPVSFLLFFLRVMVVFQNPCLLLKPRMWHVQEQG